MGVTSRNVTLFSRLRCVMLGGERSDNILEGEILGAARNDCVELVPVTQQLHWSHKVAIAPPDPSFLAQLIATAEQAPPTCGSCRGAIEGAQAAYGYHPRERRSVSRRTRQVV